MQNHNDNYRKEQRENRSRPKAEKKQPPRGPRFSHPKSRFGWGALLIFMASLLLWLRLPVAAAPPAADLNQTVPIPTATATRGFLPTATPTPSPDDGDSDDDDDDEDDEEPASGGQTGDDEEVEYGVEFGEPTPTPQGGEPATGGEVDAPVDTGTGTTTETTAPEPALQRPTAEYTGTVLALVLNVRTEPRSSARVQGTAFQDDTVGILGRNNDNSWWLICCATGEVTPGWVPMDTIAPDFAFSDAEELLEVLDDAGEQEAADVPEGNATLQLSMRHEPQFVWQDESFQVVYTLQNESDTDAVDVELRNDFDAALEFVSVDAGDDAEVLTTEKNDRTVLSVRWATLEPGAKVEVRVEVHVTTNLPDGAVIDNLAAVSAANAAAVTAGVSVSMPPVAPPDFQ